MSKTSSNNSPTVIEVYVEESILEQLGKLENVNAAFCVTGEQRCTVYVVVVEPLAK